MLTKTTFGEQNVEKFLGVPVQLFCVSLHRSAVLLPIKVCICFVSNSVLHFQNFATVPHFYLDAAKISERYGSFRNMGCLLIRWFAPLCKYLQSLSGLR